MGSSHRRTVRQRHKVERIRKEKRAAACRYFLPENVVEYFSSAHAKLIAPALSRVIVN